MTDSEKHGVVVLPLIPLRELVIFPFSVTPLYIMRAQSIAALETAMESDRRVFLVTQRTAQTDNPTQDDLYQTGTAAEVLQIIRLQDGSAKVLVEGHFIARIVDFITDETMLRAEIHPVTVFPDRGKRTQALLRTVVNQFERYVALNDRVPEEALTNIRTTDDPVHIAHTVANIASFNTEQKQDLLESVTLQEKLFKLSKLLDEEVEMLALENKIISQVKNSITRNQKEYFLNEQLKVIEKELGMSSEDDLEIEELQSQIDKLPLSDEVREKADKELGRLAKMQPYSPEATVARTYIEWLLEMPWGQSTEDKANINKAQKILDEDHYGLEKPKERILEFLAVHQLVEHMKSPILCFVGPPGVGKTSLARSVANALGRKFSRVSLGGVRDEAEIRGHRRTYIGSMPGKIIQMIKKAGAMNPVLLLDEIDKMSADFRGDPASALLEVLDPEQNSTFMDHYMEIEFDLSNVLFITTANTTAGIPLPLQDRMEIIRLPGYTEDEKRSIAGQFLIPKQTEIHGLTKRNFELENEALNLLITGYTREAGVRSLEREIASLCRKTARALVETGAKRRRKVKITTAKVREYLGPQKYRDMEISRQQGEVGVATGLAWTEVGGELLPTETMVMSGKGELMLTGKLGDVMQESAKAALSYIRTRYEQFNLEKDFYKTTDIHIHVPEGAIPKDGPSAGVTMTTSLVSALSQRPVRQDVAMTGEITLRGKVLKIGGLKEKVLAAHRAHIHRVIMPEENRDELEEISAEVRANMEFILVDHIDQVLEAALVSDKPAPKKNTTATRASKKTATARKKTSPRVRSTRTNN
ncbi:endopeptidase La [Candidatus Sumerlaeota bacterium]|nr:endopeptidase La [Candidatus Sumerlaeota bacterium]